MKKIKQLWIEIENKAIDRTQRDILLEMLYSRGIEIYHHPIYPDWFTWQSNLNRSVIKNSFIYRGRMILKKLNEMIADDDILDFYIKDDQMQVFGKKKVYEIILRYGDLVTIRKGESIPKLNDWMKVFNANRIRITDYTSEFGRLIDIKSRYAFGQLRDLYGMGSEKEYSKIIDVVDDFYKRKPEIQAQQMQRKAQLRKIRRYMKSWEFNWYETVAVTEEIFHKKERRDLLREIFSKFNLKRRFDVIKAFTELRGLEYYYIHFGWYDEIINVGILDMFIKKNKAGWGVQLYVISNKLDVYSLKIEGFGLDIDKIYDVLKNESFKGFKKHENLSTYDDTHYHQHPHQKFTRHELKTMYNHYKNQLEMLNYGK